MRTLIGTAMLFAIVALPTGAEQAAPAVGAQAVPLLTPSEASGWQALSSYADVTGFYRELQVRSPDVRLLHLGNSREGRELLAVTIARPAVTSPTEAHATGRPIVFIGAQVHGDEHAGKEGLMLFARDVALGSLQPLLNDVIFIFVPQINPDGAEAGTWGTRTNPSGYNLNRDYAQLDNPETRAVVSRGLVRWEPHVVVDAHEAVGPPRYHDFYTSYPRNHGSQVFERIIETEVLPSLVKSIDAAGFNHFFYHGVPGGVARVVAQAAPSAGPAPSGVLNLTQLPASLQESLPSVLLDGSGLRSLSSYGGPHGAITLLYESLRQRDPRIGIERRTRIHYTAMEGLARYVAQNPSSVLTAVAQAREEMISKGSRWDEADTIPIEWERYVTRNAPYRLVLDGRVVEVNIPVRDGMRPVRGRIRPEGYLIEAHRSDIARHLTLHGVMVERLLQPASVEVESFRVESVERSAPNEGVLPRTFTVTLDPQAIEVPAGTWIARAGQKRAAILFHLMEPEDTDSYATSGWFINNERVGGLFPVHRIRTLPRVPMQALTTEEIR